MSEEMRKEFEGWCIDNDLSYQMSFGQYHNAKTQNYWRIWKASRKAMKPIKLPKTMKNTQEQSCYYYNDAIDECKEVIQQAGYKVEE